MHGRALHLALTALLAVQAPAQDPINRTLLSPVSERPATPSEPLGAAFDRARAAVVHVFVEVQGDNKFKLERPSTGVLITEGGLVVTQWSLVKEAVNATDKEVFVQRAGDKLAPLHAEVVDKDLRTGLALLKLTDGGDPGSRPMMAAFDATPGDPVAVAGFPDGEDAIGFAGVLTPAVGDIAIGEGDEQRRIDKREVWLADAAIQRRAHGAALITKAGTLAGICNAEMVAREVREPTLEDLKRTSFGFAISARAIADAFPEALRSWSTSAIARSSSPASALAVTRTLRAVVGVAAGAPAPLGTSAPYAPRRRPGAGSGVIIDASGRVLTNLHLVDGADEVTVTAAGAVYSAKVVQTHRPTNSAMLQLALPEGAQVTPVALGDARTEEIGARVLAIGNPAGHTVTVAGGVLSALRGPRIQVDAATDNRNGGGPLINLQGEMIGLSDAGARDRVEKSFERRGEMTKVDTSLNFAASTETLRAVYGLGLREPASSPPPPSPAAAVVQRAGAAMLNLQIDITTAAAELDDNPFAAPSSRTVGEVLGSGVLIDPSGLALTNWHVVDSATNADGSMRADRVIHATRRDGRVFDVTVLSISREEELALLKLDLEPGEQVEFVELGDSHRLSIGDTAVAIGNPHGQANTVTAGVITAKNQAIRVRGRWAKLPHLLETDAAINSGNSGGALLDIHGRLIGINSAGGNRHAVTSYAIAVDHVREKLRSVLLSPQKLRSCWLGMTVSDLPPDGDAGPGIAVETIDGFGPAGQAGLQVGDVIRSMDGRAPRWSVGFAMDLLGKGADRELVFELQRGSSRITRPVRPWSAQRWAVFRQTGLVLNDLPLSDDPEAVRAAAVAFTRRFTGDANAAPGLIPESLIAIQRVLPSVTEAGAEVQAGDLLLGVQLGEERADGDATRLVRFERIRDAQRCFNRHGDYAGHEFSAWIYRDGEIRVVTLNAKRLML